MLFLDRLLGWVKKQGLWNLFEHSLVLFGFTGVFIVIPFLGNFRYGVIVAGSTLLFVLIGTVICFFLAYKQIWYSIWVIKLIAMVGMLVVGLTTPRNLLLGGAWLFSMYFAMWLSAVIEHFLPDCLRAPERRQDTPMKKVKVFDYIYGLRLYTWVKSGELNRPQSRYAHRVIYALDGEDLQFVEFVKTGCALRVVGGNDGNVMVQYSQNLGDVFSWRVLSRVAPDQKFSGEQKRIIVCEWFYDLPPEILFKAKEIRQLVKNFEHESDLDPQSFHWLSLKQSEPFILMLPKTLEQAH